ncbi:hypothetical protein ACGFRB_08575 [Streptomyces sp. NPDC048718]|uniref:hypothetical protein n=1 Tax=Streptomyces sp. NPDC048718 TaxID=3365587 RepID=UPI003718D76F
MLEHAEPAAGDGRETGRTPPNPPNPLCLPAPLDLLDPPGPSAPRDLREPSDLPDLREPSDLPDLPGPADPAESSDLPGLPDLAAAGLRAVRLLDHPALLERAEQLLDRSADLAEAWAGASGDGLP